MDVSLVVAAYNEEEIITENVALMVEALSSRPEVKWELLCVNDGSTDQTGQLIDIIAASDSRFTAIHHRRNFGQGRALRSAFDKCRGEVVVTIDADLSYGVENIYKLVDVVLKENVEVALASAYMIGGDVHNIPLLRRLLSKFGNYYLSFQSEYPISTSTCVVRAYHRDVIDNLVCFSDGMEMQIEILMKCHMMGYRIRELPARLNWVACEEKEIKKTRKSNMNIPKSIKLYLFMGWLFRPALIFMILGCVLLVLGGYLLFNNLFRYVSLVVENMDIGLLGALSLSLNQLIIEYPHTVIFCVTFLLFGGLMGAFSMLLIQGKAYYEDLFKLNQLILVEMRKKPAIQDKKKQGL